MAQKEIGTRMEEERNGKNMQISYNTTGVSVHLKERFVQILFSKYIMSCIISNYFKDISMQ